MFIWDEMVHRRLATEPQKIAPIVNNGFKGIAKFVQKELKKVPVTEAYAVSYYNEVDPKDSFVDVSLVRCWPNDIHIADVEFSDNRKPAHAGRKVKSSSRRNYHGLRVWRLPRTAEGCCPGKGCRAHLSEWWRIKTSTQSSGGTASR
jgi:hypothetical protein